MNAGAIVSASLLEQPTAEARFNFFQERCRLMSADKTRLNLATDVYDSETATNENNTKISKELANRKIISSDPFIALDAYTMACSLNTTCEDAAVMAATFANNGTNPITKEDVVNPEIINHTVTVMMSCGMYNGAGKWIVDVGIPAKSGVAGLVMCVVPGVCGFAVFSPRLDTNGNSARGVLVAAAMSEQLGLHVLKTQSNDTHHTQHSPSKSSRPSGEKSGSRPTRGSRPSQQAPKSPGNPKNTGKIHPVQITDQPVAAPAVSERF